MNLTWPDAFAIVGGLGAICTLMAVIIMRDW